MRQVIELREYSAETNYLKNNREENREPEQEKGATPVPVQEEEQGTSRAEVSEESKKKTERRMRYTLLWLLLCLLFLTVSRIQIRFDFVGWIRIRIQEGKDGP
jgi:hypothetical protein